MNPQQDNLTSLRSAIYTHALGDPIYFSLSSSLSTFNAIDGYRSPAWMMDSRRASELLMLVLQVNSVSDINTS